MRLTGGSTPPAQHFALVSSSVHSSALRRFLFPTPSSLLLLLRWPLPVCLCAPNCVRCIPRDPDGPSPSLLHSSALGVLSVCVCVRVGPTTSTTCPTTHCRYDGHFHPSTFHKSVCPHLSPSSLRAHYPSVLVRAETHTRCTLCSAQERQLREGTRTIALEKAKTARGSEPTPQTHAHTRDDRTEPSPPTHAPSSDRHPDHTYRERGKATA